ncbi:MAG: Nif3-like dinuclear metal center hexameric protein [Candidatus Izemoplasmatales bacterium]|jgi:dinuclear metal center YbgI/SA1388 family protein|nr:Nif3-like dinuclear metal center hexameric protein [Candidatus Izemoplasmatales bacterium]MDD3864931.1 Nif3-like dinuclear metal center hexameric protein [Candidatus Izemoplasmatales bacterium]
MNSIDVIKYLESKYPKSLAYEYDNVGLQVGTLNKKCTTVLVTLDVTKEVIAEAIACHAELIISHHPLIFKPLMNVMVESPRGSIIAQLIRHNIALYSAHTNYDLACGGMNDELAKVLGIMNPQVLDETEGMGRFGAVEPQPMETFIAFVKTQLNAKTARYIGSMNGPVKIVGISGGSGSSHVGQAMKKNCDLYITGDVTYHTALDCQAMGQNVLDIGHYAESIFKQAIQADLQAMFSDLHVLVSQINTDPYQNI